MTPNELKLGSTAMSDDEGLYTAYHRTCNFKGCGVELTSRNRAGQYLLCKPCEVMRRQIKYNNSTQNDTARIKAYNLLDAVLNNPTNAAIKKELQSLLMDLEIKALMRHLPNVAASPVSSNPQ